MEDFTIKEICIMNQLFAFCLTRQNEEIVKTKFLSKIGVSDPVSYKDIKQLSNKITNLRKRGK